MTDKIKEIFIEGGDFNNYQLITDKKDRLSDLSKINVFIGENNSGKSRFLRELFKTNFQFIRDDINIDKCNEIKRLISSKYDIIREQIRIANSPEYKMPEEDLYNKIRESTLENAKVKRKFFEDIYNFANKLKVSRQYENQNLPLLQQVQQIGADIYNELLREIPNRTNEANFQSIYIPVLRGLRHIHETTGIGISADIPATNYKFSNDNVYLKRSKYDYFKKPQEKLEFFTGLNLYENITNYLLGSQNERELVRDFEKFLSASFFHNKSVTLIPRLKNDDGTPNDVIHFKIGDEKEKPIYDLGDGIQHIIILTFQMFMNKGKNMLFFIEEPELYLHPGMQRIFLDTIITHEGFENFQYFIATHSNHFLDITLDTNKISVYTFKKTKEVDEKGHPFFSIENVTNDDIRTLELIGVRNSSVFLSNCTLWVEGITDRMYLRKYLELYQNYESEKAKKENKPFQVFKEDLHYSFVEYGGGNITHWSFTDDDSSLKTIRALRINNKILLVADKDNTKKGSKKAERHDKLKDILRDNFYLLPCKEIENLLSYSVLRKVIADYEGKKNPEDIALKSGNYEQKSLGTWINNNLDLDGKRNYADKSGTVSDKLGFAKKAIKNIDKYEDLSEEAQTLAKKIYDFIGSHNNA